MKWGLRLMGIGRGRRWGRKFVNFTITAVLAFNKRGFVVRKGIVIVVVAWGRRKRRRRRKEQEEYEVKEAEPQEPSGKMLGCLMKGGKPCG